MNFGDEMNRWWGMDEDSYLDEDGKPISKDEYFKSPVEPDKPDDLPEQPQFVGDPTQFKPMPFDPNNPMMYMGSGNPFYHLRGAGAEDDEMARRMAEYLAPHISDGIGQIADGIQDFFKTPEQREQEKRDKEALEEAERRKKEREEGSWSSYLSPFFGNGKSPFYHMRGGEMGDDGGMTLAEWNCREGIGNCIEKDGTPIDRYAGSGVLPPQDSMESKKENPMVEEVIEEPMDDGDIRSYFPNAKIIRYSSLARLGNIEQLLPTDKSYAFLLYEDSPGSGHWVVLLRYGNTIEFFCSYGSKIDAPLRWYNPKDNAMLGQSKPYLSLLLKKAGKRFKAVHNAVPFQSSKRGVATCGAWDVMRVNQLVNHNQDLQEFQDYMEQVKKETGLTYDEIVVNYVSKR
jgi:hypothetical protein